MEHRHSQWYVVVVPTREETMGWIRSERGASLIEWAMLVVLIAIVALIAVKFVGAQHSEMWSEIASSLP